MSTPKFGDTVMALFVGGPRDGCREAVRYSERYIVPVYDPPSLLKDVTLRVTDPPFFKQVVYRVRHFAGARMRFVIYAEESLTADDVMGLLWDHYTPPPVAEKERPV